MRSNRYETIKHLFEVRKNCYLGKSLAHPQIGCWRPNHRAARRRPTDNLMERLELLILDTKAGRAGLIDEMFKTSKKLLSMNI